MSDQGRRGYMAGVPPAADDLITDYAVMGTRDDVRWTLHHARELLPSVQVRAADASAVHAFRRRLQDLSKVPVPIPGNDRYTVADWLVDTDSDGLIVLQRGDLIFEHYAGGMRPHEPHSVMSDTKSLVGTLAAELMSRGVISAEDPVTRHVPELRGTGWDGVPLQRALDMTTNVAYTEDYEDPDASVYRYSHALGWDLAAGTRDGPADLLSYLRTVGVGDPANTGFEYQTVNTEVVSWVLQRATQTRLNELVSELIWQPIGAEFDAYFVVDPHGMAAAGGGFNATLRDMARFGQLICDKGVAGGKQVLHEATFGRIFVDDYPVRLNGVFPGEEKASYHNFWYLHYDPSVLIANGIHGQFVYVNLPAQVVIVKMSSAPQAMPKVDLTWTPPLRDRGFAAIVDALSGV